MCSSIHDFLWASEAGGSLIWHWCQTSSWTEVWDLQSGLCSQHHQRLWVHFDTIGFHCPYYKAWLDQRSQRRDLIIPVLVSSPNLGHLAICEICLPPMTPLLPCLLLLHHFISCLTCLSFSCVCWDPGVADQAHLFSVLFQVSSPGWPCLSLMLVQVWAPLSWHTNGLGNSLGFSGREGTKPSTGPSISICFPLLYISQTCHNNKFISIINTNKHVVKVAGTKSGNICCTKSKGKGNAAILLQWKPYYIFIFWLFGLLLLLLVENFDFCSPGSYFCGWY